MEFRILGPIEVLTGERSLFFPRRQQRLIVGILSLEVNRAVSFERLIELLWGPNPPREPRAVLQTRISEARRILSGAPEWAAEVELTTYHDGYVLKADPDRVDAYRFSRLLEIARAATDDDARRVLRQAVGIWRGRALGGWLTKADADLCLSLESARLTAIEDLYDAELRVGRHYEVVDEIIGLAAANPGRERLTLQLMQALHLSGRTAEALAVYRRMRRWLKEELGLDPPAKVESLHRCILRGAAEHRRTTTVDERTDASLPHSFTSQRPCLLPAGIADFAGREKDLAAVADLLTERSDGSAPTTVAIDGAGGVGKTALTLHVAHRLRGHFSDGQLYASLRGFGQGPPVETRDVLGRFLRALGVTAVPDDMDDRIGLYRRLLDGRKVLVVLDDVADARQVLPLVPGSSSCAVLVNSRPRLATELGAHAVGLDVLDPSASSILLARIGGARIRAEPQPARELAALCGHLPLALRIAAAKLAAKPYWSVQRLVDQLAETHTRLGHLSFGQMDVQSTITMSYGGLTPSAQRLLRRLGHVNLPDVTVWTAAATLDSKLDEAEELLDQLYNARLVEVAGLEPTGHARYRLHDLVRLFAAARAATEEHADELNRVRQRVLGCWLCLADTAYRRVYGGDYQNAQSPAYRWRLDEHIADTVVADPLRWFDADRQTIMSLIRLAADHGDSSACWGLASTTSPLFQIALLHNAWADVLDLAMDAALRAGDELGQAAVQYRMGILRIDWGDYQEAKNCFESAELLFEKAKDDHGTLLASMFTATVDRLHGEPKRALTGYKRAIPELESCGDHGAAAFAERGAGQIHLDRADHEAADEHLTRAAALARLSGSRRTQAQVGVWQGMLRLRQKRYEEALALFTEALEVSRLFREVAGQAQALRMLGRVHQSQGNVSAARQSFTEALRLIQQPRHTHLAEGILGELARLSR